VVGDYMLGRLREMKEKFPFIGDVRGQGLLLGMDLVRDRRSREPLPLPAMHRIYRECVRRGLLCMIYSPRVRLHPPLTITRRLAAWGLDVLEEVFGLVGTKIRIN
jgi:4-aminobutyrate aminotransferase-like enzyme